MSVTLWQHANGMRDRASRMLTCMMQHSYANACTSSVAREELDAKIRDIPRFLYELGVHSANVDVLAKRIEVDPDDLAAFLNRLPSGRNCNPRQETRDRWYRHYLQDCASARTLAAENCAMRKQASDAEFTTHSLRSDYAARMKVHLRWYKEHVLRVKQCGTWRGREYGHILPEAEIHLNILPACHDAFWERHREKRWRLHKDFGHLNSSQAMCFNLFFPFLREPGLLPLLLDALDLNRGQTSAADFEVVLDRCEGTNHDFYVCFEAGSRLFWETKLTEAGFGAPENQGRLDKFNATYRPKLEVRLEPEALIPETFFNYYQVFRIVWYLKPADTAVFVLPRANSGLRHKLDAAMRLLTENVRDRQVRVIYLEDAINKIDERVASLPCLAEHYRAFRQKYLPDDSARQG